MDAGRKNAHRSEWLNCHTRQKFCRCPDSDSKKPRCACENWIVLKGTVPVVANGGIGDTTGTVPFVRKAPALYSIRRRYGIKTLLTMGPAAGLF